MHEVRGPTITSGTISRVCQSPQAPCRPLVHQGWVRSESSQYIDHERLTPYMIPFRLVQDQNEVNRIIAEVSKGSKFYEASVLLACSRQNE